MRLSLGRDSPGCTPNCGGYLDAWARFWAEHTDPSAPPVALMRCPGYYQGLRRQTRALIRQARKRYEFTRIGPNEHLHQIQALNFSKPETSSGPTYGWFVNTLTGFPEPDLCEIHGDIWYAGFDDEGTMRGYLRLCRTNRLAVLHDIFSHAEQSTGVQTGLFAYAAEHAGVDWISYHTMTAGPPGREAFKRHSGFRPYRLKIVA